MSASAYVIYTVILLAAFAGIVVWVYSKKRKLHFDREARIPFDEKPD
ncbi:cbb3-type cytochrome oxidase subunit 3 [Sulfuriferula sp. GW1]